MSTSKKALNIIQYQYNPFFTNDPTVEFYDDSRDEQIEDMNQFIKSTQDILNKNIYESYKSFFYRYHDYNQINR